MPYRDAIQSVPALAPPPCPLCRRADPVYALPVTDLSPGVQYFRCDHCGFVWATLNGEEFHSIAVNHKPGKVRVR